LTSSAIDHDDGDDHDHEAAISKVYAITIPRIKGYFSGVGDLFSALVLGHFEPSSGSDALCRATSAALSTTQSILLATQEHWQTLPEEERPVTDDERDEEDAERRVIRMRSRELRIVQGLDVIRSPPQGRDLVRWDNFWKAAEA